MWPNNIWYVMYSWETWDIFLSIGLAKIQNVVLRFGKQLRSSPCIVLLEVFPGSFSLGTNMAGAVLKPIEYILFLGQELYFQDP